MYDHKDIGVIFWLAKQLPEISAFRVSKLKVWLQNGEWKKDRIIENTYIGSTLPRMTVANEEF